jgi:hypothetical protein
MKHRIRYSAERREQLVFNFSVSKLVHVWQSTKSRIGAADGPPALSESLMQFTHLAKIGGNLESDCQFSGY